VIEACRKEKEAFDTACAIDPDAYLDGPASVLFSSYDVVADTVPTTREGVIAKLVFIDEVTDRTPDAFDAGEMLSMLAAAAKRLMVA
jgi:hypothetical protein